MPDKLDKYTPWRALNSYFRPENKYTAFITKIVSVILGILVVPTLASHAYYSWKDRQVKQVQRDDHDKIVQIAKAKLYAETTPSLDTSNITQMKATEPEFKYQTVFNVGYYQPLGYMTQELFREARNEISYILHGNKFIRASDGGYYIYDENALYKLLAKNQALLPDLRLAIMEGDKNECARQFIYLLERGRCPEELEFAAFGERLNYEEETIGLPEGLTDLVQLQKEHPKHDWYTIQNLLGYLLLADAYDPAKEAKAILDKLPTDKVYAFRNGHCYTID